MLYHLQVRHSRLCSIEENNLELLPLLDECASIPEETPDFAKLSNHLCRFPEVILSTTEKAETVPISSLSYRVISPHWQSYTSGEG
ncbi:hypothetical protein KIN20_025217 [Parelaphostrongylus tenuis]|uniref:Uncharacterized protein n=1 Tax=Parelaphostrongylus tenuis TaxID=148309 RepID=A0AAD5NAL8_PARTN|nr:hypothetical protein KIN20_025217 [Parelaphostrongylus tenuis]